MKETHEVSVLVELPFYIEWGQQAKNKEEKQPLCPKWKDSAGRTQEEDFLVDINLILKTRLREGRGIGIKKD